MKGYIKIIVFIFACCFAFSNCTNLDEKPYGYITGDDFFANEKMLQAYSGTAFQMLQNYCTEQSLWTLNIQAADECAVPRNSDGAWTDLRYRELQRHTFAPNNKLILMGWDFCFQGIASCNKVYKAIATSPSEFPEKKKILSELRVLRAFYYYLAMDGWANIPFSIDPDDKSMPPRKERAFIFDFIEKEIDSCINDLDIMPSGNNYGRITQGVANTLKAKLYLNAEVYLGQPMYDKAEQACLEVINSGSYAVESNYKTNFEVNNETSRENIFVIPYDNVYVSSADNAFVIFVMALDAVNAEKFNISTTLWNGFVCQPDFFALYDSNDSRRSDSWLYGLQYNKAGMPIDTHIIQPIFSDAKYETGRAFTDGAKLWKWTYQMDGELKGDERGMSNDFALFRYADVLYMYAEALMRQGKGVSAALSVPGFETIRTRANMPPLSSSLTLDELLVERGVEFAWEGWRRQDLIRFGQWSKAWWAKPNTSAATRNIYPIPTERLSVNTNLQQNPGY
jgi:hypothetical protein